MMSYKGYVASVEFDDEAGVLYGRVINAGPYPIATFEATDVSQLRSEFQKSVEEYLISCDEDGVEPKPPHSGELQLRLSPDLYTRVAESAMREGMSVNFWVNQALERMTHQSADRQSNFV